MNDEETAADLWVRVMADFGGDGLWRRDGCMMGRDDLPVSDDLSAWHARWCRWFDDSFDAGPSFDTAAFAAEGLRIAKAIKAELPAWTVIYFDEHALAAGRPRSEFEYEIPP